MRSRIAVSPLVLSGVLASAALLSSSCGYSSPSSPSVGSATVTITASGVTPGSLTVSPGAIVTFVNQDSVEHDIASNPHPAHTDCPEISQIGSLNPGQSKQTAAFGSSRRTCGFHDDSRPGNPALGTITVY
jgi:plastocyanin